MKKTIVQIGLHFTPEYLNLVDPTMFDIDHIGELPPLLFQEFKTETEWCYYGVDMSKGCIACLQEKFKAHKEQVKFIEALVLKEDGQTITHNGYNVYLDLKENELWKQTSQSISLNTLFNDINEPVFLFVMDVEGSELEILQGYDWSQTPPYIIIEMHSLNNLIAIEQIMKDHDYIFKYMTHQRATDMICGYVHTSVDPRLDDWVYPIGRR